MVWSWFDTFTDNVKRRTGKYLINKYLGPYLEDSGILAEQLVSVDSDISLLSVALNIAKINELLEDSDLPVEFVDGYIGELTASVPWKNLLQENCFFAIDGMTITLQVKEREHPAQISASIFHSMCESFSSVNMAEECIREDEEVKKGIDETDFDKSDSAADESNAKVKGVELMAQAIDSIIMRVKMTLKNTTIRLEYVPTIESRGMAIEVKIGKIMYAGELGSAPKSDTRMNDGSSMTSSTVKKVYFEDVSFCTDEFTFSKAPNNAFGMTRSTSRQSSSASGQHEKETCDEEEEVDPDPPLPMAVLSGKQELILKFQELNQYGLPRSIDEIELSLGGLSFHLYPHQIHILTEIVSAVTVPQELTNDESEDSIKRQQRMNKNLEALLQKSMIQDNSRRGEVWSNASKMDHSCDFQPVTSNVPGIETGFATAQAPAANGVIMPRILVKMVTLSGVLLEKDLKVAKLGGETSKEQASAAMRGAAFKFFNGDRQSGFGTNAGDRLGKLHTELLSLCSSANISVAASLVSVVHEEGSAIAATAGRGLSLVTTVSAKQISVKEVLYEDPLSNEPTTIVELVKFKDQLQSPDLRVVYKELKNSPSDEQIVRSKLEIILNPCLLDFEVGLIDRTYMIFNYSDMDTEALKTPPDATEVDGKQVELEIIMQCPDINLLFHVPKVDLRQPKDIPRFIDKFWSRKVHEELLDFNFKNFHLTVKTHGSNIAEPLLVTIRSDQVEVVFQESPESDRLPLIKIRKSKGNERNQVVPGAFVRVAVCLDESRKLQGKFTSENMQGNQKDKGKQGMSVGSFFVSDSGNVTGGANSSSQSTMFTQQLEAIEEALSLGRSKHNIFVDLSFDEVSLLLPSKRVYEIVYNRLGNDMLLWLPEVFKVKEFLYEEPLPDPLRDPDIGFSACFSGNHEKLEWEGNKDKGPNSSYVSFPRDKSSVLTIHIDTCVSLSVNEIHAAITTYPFKYQEELGLDQNPKILTGNIQNLKLCSVVGLERDPEIVLFNLSIGKAELAFGDKDLAKKAEDFHYNWKSLGVTSNLISINEFRDRAWLDPPDLGGVLKLTAKVLFDSSANLKTINLAFTFCDLGVSFSTLVGSPEWIDWLADFFTVVEYPVDGYIPPAILTEMQFDIRRCAVNLKPKNYPTLLALTLGHARVACNLLDSAQDIGIIFTLEDMGLFASQDTVEPTQNAVCLADVDYLDLEISLKDIKPKVSLEKEGEKVKPYLDVVASCNRLRIRTCPDSISLIGDLIQNLIHKEQTRVVDDVSKHSSREGSVESQGFKMSDEPILNAGQDDLPDIAAAMDELMANEAEEEREKRRKISEELKKRQEAEGAQVFFFPNEGQKVMIAELEGLETPAPLPAESSFDSEQDSSYEEFCILEDEIGSGIVASFGQPTSKTLCSRDDVIIKHRKCFEMPSKTIDYLKSPASFPKFQSRVTIKRFSVEWQIFGGNDFSSNKNMAVNTRSRLGLSPPPGEPVIRQDSSWDGSSSPARQRADELKTRGGPGRDTNQQIVVLLSKIQLTHEMYPDDCKEASRQVLVVPLIEIHDRHYLSQIKKLLHLYSSRSRPKQSNANMLSVRCLHMRSPDCSTESSIFVSMQPIRINIDQDTLFFLMDFGGTLNPKGDHQTLSSRPAVSCGQVVAYNRGMQAIEVTGQDEEVGIDALAEEEKQPGEPSSNPSPPTPIQTTPTPSIRPGNNTETKRGRSTDLFIKSFVFSPEVPVRIDYSAKYVDLSQGALAGLLAGLTSLNCSELTLKEVAYPNGILGFDRLLSLLVTEWLGDIRQNQIPRLLGGVGPMYSVLQLFQGIKDLILLPLEQYQKDGRLFRGIQKGANSFTTSTAMSLLDFTNKILGVIKFTAELAYDIMSPEAMIVQGRLPHQHVQRRQVVRSVARPADLREGVFNAIAIVREGIDETARALADAASSERMRGRGISGAVSGVLRQVPSTLVKPVIVTAEATANVLEGVQSQVAPDVRREEEEKWRGGNDLH